MAYLYLENNLIFKIISRANNNCLLTVSSKPSIINIISSPCNSSLLIEWKPHIHAAGFTHELVNFII